MKTLSSSFVSLLSFTILLLFFPNITHALVEDEAKGLLIWKSTFSNQHSSLASWTISGNGDSPCNWYGVCCAAGSVNRLVLNNSHINGTLESFPFYNLPNLEYLEISFNQLSGTIPPQIANLSKLIYLSLSNNHFTGAIPPQIALLNCLNTLRIDSNHLSRSIPPELGNLSKLNEMFIFSNNLSGHIPAELSRLLHLTKLNLSHNSLGGVIPSSFKRLGDLVNVDLSYNELTGAIPDTMGFKHALLMGNKGLCGDNVDLQPCTDPPKKSSVWNKKQSAPHMCCSGKKTRNKKQRSSSGKKTRNTKHSSPEVSSVASNNKQVLSIVLSLAVIVLAFVARIAWYCVLLSRGSRPPVHVNNGGITLSEFAD